ncbi:septation protein SepH [Actinomadura sp. WMMB 499]|uniref:septation protein SepH n=1 Tax=Actinomadura sp. WMMB 499 TaxID=1219491 RepID=UPI0020C79C94|nr:septation protein SepH [Actinomadura sp. WMMB 499]
MQELRLVAVSEDGTYLVLATAGRGTRFTLPVDDRVRAAVRGHFSRLGQFEIEVESPLRPKEIQARIRSGETAEEIAESAGIPVERVRWFEGPVLQEREYMAQQAQRVTVRRPGESTPGPPLGETVEERLGRGGVDLEDVEWDAWKCDDGTWRVRLSFFDNGRPHAAEWAFDPRRRNVSPLDEIAARLTAVDWDDDELSDTVTPLVPRRPAMKVVSDGRDAGREVGPRDLGRGLPTEAEPPLERASEPPLRAAEPREYIVERGRIIDPRPAFPSRQQPGRPREIAADREPIRPFDDAEAPASGAPWRRAPEPSLEELDLQAEPAPAGPEAERDEEPHGERASAGAAADETEAGEPVPAASAASLAETEPEAPEDRDLREESADEGDDEHPDTAGADTTAEAEDAEAEDAEDEAAAEEPAEAGDGPAEAAEAAAPVRPHGDDADADARPADEPEEHAEPEAHDEPEGQADAAAEIEDEVEDEDEPEAAAADVAAAEPRGEPAPDDRARPERPKPAAPREQPAAPREQAPREQAPREQAQPAAPQRPPRREPARPPAKKKPAARPTMPAAQDKPVTGPPPAAAAADSSPAQQRPARARRKSKGKRASVPSWDEIMFGARRPE